VAPSIIIYFNAKTRPGKKYGKNQEKQRKKRKKSI
jgi:hypothetical protein